MWWVCCLDVHLPQSPRMRRYPAWWTPSSTCPCCVANEGGSVQIATIRYWMNLRCSESGSRMQILWCCQQLHWANSVIRVPAKRCVIKAPSKRVITVDISAYFWYFYKIRCSHWYRYGCTNVSKYSYLPIHLIPCVNSLRPHTISRSLVWHAWYHGHQL